MEPVKSCKKIQVPSAMIEFYLLFFCSASGTPSVGWFKVDKFGGNPKPIVSSGRYKKLLDGRRLQITDPTYTEDNGVYKCIPEYGLTSYEKQAKTVDLVVSCKFQSFIILSFDFVQMKEVIHYCESFERLLETIND